MKVVICGSTNASQEQIDLIGGIFTKFGNDVVVPSHKTENLIQKRANYLHEIETADLVVIVPKSIGGVPAAENDECLLYKIGESTSYEYLYAIKYGIPTVILDHPNYEDDLNSHIQEFVEKTSP